MMADDPHDMTGKVMVIIEQDTYHEMKARIGELEQHRDAWESEAHRLEADNARLRETLAFAAQYKGFEGRACPLCTYENGKFIKRCQMHTDMDALQLQLIGLESKYADLVSLQSATLLESQQKDWENARLRAELEEARAWEAIEDSWFDFYWDEDTVDIPVDPVGERAYGYHVYQHESLGQILDLWVHGSVRVTKMSEKGMRIQRRAPSEGEVVDGE